MKIFRMLRTFCLDSGSFGEGIPAAETGVTSWGLCCSCYAKAEPGYNRRCPANSPRVPGAVVLLGSGEGLGCAGLCYRAEESADIPGSYHEPGYTRTVSPTRRCQRKV